MGVVTELINDLRSIRERNVTSWSGVSQYVSGRAGFPDSKYKTYADEGYRKNVLVFASIEELASSASEPDMQVMQANKWHHQFDGGSSSAARLLTILNNPNPFMDHYEMWRTVILHRSLAGNAYALKVRSQSGRVVELWLLRPDRVHIVPSATHFIDRYEYNIGSGEPIPLPVNDVIHWKTPNPLDDFYGMPPLAAIAGNVDLDNYARDFVKTYFEKAGVPAGMLTTKGPMTDDLKKEIKERYSREHGGGNWHGLMVLDGAEASYTQMTQSLGAQGLVLPELNAISESRIPMAFGVPPELLGAKIGLESSSYANKRAAREGFWNETLKPLYRELVGPINRGLISEFPGVQQVAFDLSTVGALQEDDDSKHARLRSDLMAGGITQEEFREATGREPKVTVGTYLIPANLVPISAAKMADDTVDLSDVRMAQPSTNGSR